MKTIIGIIVVLIILGAGYYYFYALQTPGDQPAPQTTQSQTKEFTLNIKNKKLDGSSTLTVKVGDTVTLHIMSDEAEEIHVHGYDKSVEFEANEAATLSFVADQSGRFPFELENSKTDLGTLEVLP